MAEQQHTIHVDIVSAEGEIFSGAAKMVFAPASQGDLGITPRHAPLLSLLKAGEVRVQTPDDVEHVFYVGGGAIEIQPQKVTVLADTAARAKDLDEAAALSAKQRAEEALKDRSGRISQAEALAELARAAAQLKVIERLRKIRG
jgi:F-type H+-transporting ATPase subunit epsilon